MTTVIKVVLVSRKLGTAAPHIVLAATSVTNTTQKSAYYPHDYPVACVAVHGDESRVFLRNPEIQFLTVSDAFRCIRFRMGKT